MKVLVALLGILLATVSAEFNDEVAAVGDGDVFGGLGLSHDPGTWFESVYVSTEVAGMALSPWFLVTFSLRQWALFVLVLNVASSTLIPFCPYSSGLYLLRGLQGLSEGFTIPLLMTTALRALPPPIRLYGLAIYALSATFTPALASSMAALWTDLVGWQFVFLESIPLCAIAGVLIWYGMPQDPFKLERFRIFDWRGTLLLVIGFGSFTTMLQQGDRLDWFNSNLICTLGLTSLVAVPLFFVNEWFQELPLFKVQLLGRRNLAYGCSALFIFTIMSGSSSTLPDDFLREVQGFRPEQFYLVTLLIACSQLVLLPATAWLLDHRRVDSRVVSFIGLVMILAACVGGSFVTIRWFRGQFYLWQMLQSVGQALVVMPLLMMATNTVQKPDEGPFTSAAVNMPRAVAGAVSTWLFQLIQRWRGGLHYNRLVDQVGGDRWRLIQASAVLPGHPTPLLPNGQPSAPGSLETFQDAITQQAQILTMSDTYLVLAAVTAVLIAILLILPERTLPPRLQFAKH